MTDNVGIMNRAASENVLSPVWPIVSRVLTVGTARTPRDQQVVDILDDWACATPRVSMPMRMHTTTSPAR